MEVWWANSKPEPAVSSVMRGAPWGIRMVSTFLTYDLINRDMKASISRVSQQGIVERQTKYYKENIGNVKASTSSSITTSSIPMPWMPSVSAR